MSPPSPSRRSSPRRSRAWLFGPFVALGALAIGWSIFWYQASARAEAALDTLLIRESALGRDWTCADRRIGGYPFRFELRCSGLSLAARRADGALTVATGPLEIVAQVYNPQHIIARLGGPGRVTQPDGATGTLNWEKLESSLFLSGLGLDRLSTFITEPQLEWLGETPFRASTLEVHTRRSPTRPLDQSVVDLVLIARGAVLPLLDRLAGNVAAADIDLDASLTRSTPLLAGLRPENIDLWRKNGGQLEIGRLGIRKGTGRLETRGEFTLDDLRRVSGRLDASAAGIDRIAGIPLGSLGGLGNLGGLLGGRGAAPNTGASTDPDLKPLPAIVFRDGRVQVGPFRIPGLQLQPLY